MTEVNVIGGIIPAFNYQCLFMQRIKSSQIDQKTFQILNVDAELSICKALGMALASQGFMLDVATNGEV
jgi:hypothetical protein